MSELQPLISIITVNYNQLGVTVEMLNSVRELSYPNVEVILVDNASKENPLPYLAANFPEVKTIRSEENLGFSGGNNLGIRQANGEFLFFVNNDTELADGLIETLLALFQQRPKLGIVSPLIRYFPSEETNGKDIIQYAGTTHVSSYTARNTTVGVGEEDQGQYQIAQPTAYVHGAAMMVPAQVVNEVGEMPEVFFLYYEELDWSEQIRNAGYEVYIEPNAKIYHKESVSVGKLSTLKTYYLNRNRIFFMRRNRSIGQLLIFSFFLVFFTIPKNVLMYLFKGELDHLKAFTRAIWWNLSRADRSIASSKTPVNTFYTTSNSKV